MVKKKISIIYTTIDSYDKAEELAAKVLMAKLASCVNIIPECKSIYIFNGGIKKHMELYMIFKTTENKVVELEECIIGNHPYKVPAILKLDGETSSGFFEYIAST
jgi:periplasmic divalent cation tolerance protein